jgi:uncharacterized protein (DUF433 family)
LDRARGHARDPGALALLRANDAGDVAVIIFAVVPSMAQSVAARRPARKGADRRIMGQRCRQTLEATVTQEALLARISIDPNICFGKPCIRGHRIWVSLILDLLASGLSIPEIVDDYEIEEVDVRACIAYGAEMARERYVTVPTTVR